MPLKNWDKDLSSLNKEELELIGLFDFYDCKEILHSFVNNQINLNQFLNEIEKRIPLESRLDHFTKMTGDSLAQFQNPSSTVQHDDESYETFMRSQCHNLLDYLDAVEIFSNHKKTLILLNHYQCESILENIVNDKLDGSKFIGEIAKKVIGENEKLTDVELENKSLEFSSLINGILNFNPNDNLMDISNFEEERLKQNALLALQELKEFEQ